MKCPNCKCNLPPLWLRWEQICPGCGRRNPPTWLVLILALVCSIVVPMRLWSALEDGLDDLLTVLSVAGGAYLVAHFWIWFAVLWRRRKAVMPQPVKST